MTPRAWAGVAVLAALVAGCSPAASPAPATVHSGPVEKTAPAQAGAPACDPRASLRPTGSLPAPNAMPNGSFMQTIHERGRLRVGTSQDTLLFSSRNPFTGVVEGFDVDVARLVAAAIFGDPDRIQLVVVPNAERVPATESDKVDLVAETMTINCERLQSVDFSSVYYQAGQKVLVATNSPARGIADLGGKRVCAAAGSTSLANLAKQRPAPIGVAAPTQSQCLVLFQEGQVEAISTDDTILAGLAAQDPYAHVVGAAFTDEPYGVAIAKTHPEFTRFVNAVLQQARADGSWARLYGRWLGAQFGPAPAPPAARYRD
jgi:polar amino acid transport system substrate-binding protein